MVEPKTEKGVFKADNDKLKSLEDFISSFTQSEDKDMAIVRIAENLVKEDKKEMLSDLSFNEIENFTILCVLDYGLNSDMKGELLQEFINKKLLFKISKERKGRKELIELSKSLYIGLAEEGKGIMERFIGKR